LVFTDKPYIVNAQALTDALVVSVHKSAITAEIARDGRFALRMLAGISRRLHGLVRDVQAYALDSGVQRVIGYLLRELPDDEAAAPDRVRQLSLPVSKATIASRLSLTPEYFSRVLRELEAHGLIEVNKRDVRIPDVQRLADYFHHQGR
jgi:CRP-like cAMP-binding protein